MKIAFFEIKKWEEEHAKKKLKGHKLYFFRYPLNLKNIDKAEQADIIVSFIYSELNAALLGRLNKLKFIATMSTGFDHIDLEFCRKNNIKISNVPYYGENTVAEHTFALILALSRKIHNAIEKTKREDFSLSGLIGFDLKGKTLGVIGPGHIGQHVIKIARGFDMNVISHSVHQDKNLSRKLGFKWVSSINKLLKESDIVTIHAPLNESTKHMINMGNIKNFKRGAYLINTARGEIVDNAALLYGLDNGIWAGAGLDVLEGECNIKEEKEFLHSEKECDWRDVIEAHLLLKEKNVIVTPHCAFYTQEALMRILDTTLDNVNGFLKGRVINRVA